MPPNYYIEDAFVSTINGLCMDRIDIIKNKDGNKEITFSRKGKEGKIIITIDKENRMISYYDDISEYIERTHYLFKAKYLKCVQLPKIKRISDVSFTECSEIEEFYAPLLEEVGNYFLKYNSIEKVSFPSLKEVRDNFMEESPMLEEIDLPNLEKAGSDFISEYNDLLENLNIPKLLIIPKSMLECCISLKYVYAPSATKMEENAFYYNEELKSLIAPKMSKIDIDTILTQGCSLDLKHLCLAEKVEVGEFFLGEKIENSLSTFEKTILYGEPQIRNIIKVGNIKGKGKIDNLKSELSSSPKTKTLYK